MKVNIIGGNGLVGSGISALLSEKHSVRVFGSNDFDIVSRRFKQNDVFDCDLLIHAAGVTDELIVNDYSLSVFKSNEFIKYIVDGIEKTGCSNVIYISTIHAFGDLTKELSGSTSSYPKSIYGLLHFSAEKMFEILIKKTTINYLGLRIPTIYGLPRDKLRINRPDIIQFAFPIAVKKNKSIKLRSSGNQYRLFASNYKVGGVINEWINDPFKNQITTDALQGINITVKDFANICLKSMASMTHAMQLLLKERMKRFILRS